MRPETFCKWTVQQNEKKKNKQRHGNGNFGRYDTTNQNEKNKSIIFAWKLHLNGKLRPVSFVLFNQIICCFFFVWGYFYFYFFSSYIELRWLSLIGTFDFLLRCFYFLVFFSSISFCHWAVHKRSNSYRCNEEYELNPCIIIIFVEMQKKSENTLKREWTLFSSLPQHKIISSFIFVVVVIVVYYITYSSSLQFVYNLFLFCSSLILL